MNCPTCGYDFDPTRGLACPRCNEPLECSAVDCGECGACSGVVGDLQALFGGRTGGSTATDESG